jgi:hypothetical protein
MGCAMGMSIFSMSMMSIIALGGMEEDREREGNCIWWCRSPRIALGDGDEWKIIVTP